MAKQVDPQQQNIALTKLKDELTAAMSHDLRSPLNNILGYALLLNNGNAGAVNSEQKEYLAEIIKGAEHLLELLTNFLDVNTLSTNVDNIELFPEKIDPQKIINEMCIMLKTFINKKKLKIEIKPEPNLNNITTDPYKFKQIIYTLILGAIKYAAIQSQLSIDFCSKDNSHFCVNVAYDFDPTQQQEFSIKEFIALTTEHLIHALGGSIEIDNHHEIKRHLILILPRRFVI